MRIPWSERQARIAAAIFAIPCVLWDGGVRVVKTLVVVGSLLLWLAVWHTIDLYQLATWPRCQLEDGDSIEPDKLLKLALFGLGVLLCLGGFIYWATSQHFTFAEWFPPVFVLGFLYAVASVTRF